MAQQPEAKVSEGIPALKGGKGKQTALQPSTMQQAWWLSGVIVKGGLAVKGDTQETVMTKIVMGSEVGLSPMQAIQNIAVINGRPSVWGDAMLGIVQTSKHYVSHKEWFSDDGKTAYCTIVRRDQEPYTVEFSQSDAEAAGLWGKDVWKKYPQRMLQMRARAWACRDKFADALRGMQSAEEQRDIIDVTQMPESPEEQADQITAASATAEPASHARSQDASKSNSGEGSLKIHGTDGAEQNTQSGVDAGPAQDDPKPLAPPEIPGDLLELIDAHGVLKEANGIFANAFKALPIDGTSLHTAYKEMRVLLRPPYGRDWDKRAQEPGVLEAMSRLKKLYWDEAEAAGFAQPGK